MGAALVHVAAQTAGMLPSDLRAIVADAAAAAAVRAVDAAGVLSAASSSAQPAAVDGALPAPPPALRMGAQDFEQALSNLRQRTAIAIGAPQACRGRSSTVVVNQCLASCMLLVNRRASKGLLKRACYPPAGTARCPTCSGRTWAAWRTSRRLFWKLWSCRCATRISSRPGCAAARACCCTGRRVEPIPSCGKMYHSSHGYLSVMFILLFIVIWVCYSVACCHTRGTPPTSQHFSRGPLACHAAATHGTDSNDGKKGSPERTAL